MSSETVQELFAAHTPKQIALQLVYLPYRNAQKPAGFLVKAIEGNWAPPQAYLDTKAQEEKQAASAKEAQVKKAEKAEENAELEKRKQLRLEREKQLSPTERNALLKQADAIIFQSEGPIGSISLTIDQR